MMKSSLVIALLCSMIAVIAVVSNGAQVGAGPAWIAVWIKEDAAKDLKAKIDGTNATFVLSHRLEDPAELGVYLNGVYQSYGDDYTIANVNSVVFVHAPSRGDRVSFWYRGGL